MFRNPSLAGVRAGNEPLRPEFAHKKALLIAGQGRYSVRARERRQNAPVALRNPQNRTFGVSRHETIV